MNFPSFLSPTLSWKRRFLNSTMVIYFEGIHLPAGIYLFEVNSRNTRTKCEICSKSTIKNLYGNKKQSKAFLKIILECFTFIVSFHQTDRERIIFIRTILSLARSHLTWILKLVFLDLTITNCKKSSERISSPPIKYWAFWSPVFLTKLKVK